MNECGLLEAPEAGNWMDLLAVRYNVLYDNVLWFAALAAYTKLRDAVGVAVHADTRDASAQPEIGALPRLGFTQFVGVRQGKRFELEVDGEVTPEVLAAAEEAAKTLLSNPVIEDVVRVADAS